MNHVRETAATLLLLATLALASGGEARAVVDVQARPAVELTAAVQLDGADPRVVQGKMTIHNWQTESRELCLYLPYLDPEFGEDHGTSRRFEILASKGSKLTYGGGEQVVTIGQGGAPGRVEASLPSYIVRVLPAAGAAAQAAKDLVLEFHSRLPRLQSSDHSSWFFDGYLPELLAKCPAPHLDPVYYRRPLAMAMTAKIQTPPSWDYAGPGERQADGTVNAILTGRTFAFGLDQKLKVRKFHAGTVDVTLQSHSEAFAELEETLKQTIPEMERMLGPYPFKTLTVLETSELARHGLPGLIAMNRPRQFIFETLQQSWMNWQHWILAIQLAHQWYGGAIMAASADDDWLTNGIAEFATLEALAHHPARFNLFNPSTSGFRLLSFDYLQVAELTAATLQYGAPLAVITTSDHTAADPSPQQHPLLFVKQAFAMRQMKGFAGDGPFYGFLRNFTNHHMYRQVSAQDFYGSLHAMPSPFAPTVRESLGTFLDSWWAKRGWPDFALTGFDSEPLPDGRWISHVKAGQDGGIDFPPLIGVKDQSGKTTTGRAINDDSEPATPNHGWKATIITEFKPRQAEVDPDHETFDEDRFNNSSRTLPQFSVFPGGADTLRDDAYTLLWVPLGFKHPGEPFSIGFEAALFRYVQSGMMAHVSIAPSTKQVAFDLTHDYQISRYALSGEVSLSGDIYNDRQAETVLKRSPLFSIGPNISPEVHLRHKAQAGHPETEHTTVVAGIEVAPVGVIRNCGYDIGGDVEYAPRSLAHGFQYTRSTGVAKVDCYLTPRINLQLRGFRGVLAGDGPIPDMELFKPFDLHEARLRLDRTDIPWVASINSGGVDLLVPFYIPLPTDTLILARQMRWRLFYDTGYAVNQKLLFRDGGLGFQMPLGGDLSGAGSLALTRLSILTVLYTTVGNEISKKPSLLFDFTGDL